MLGKILKTKRGLVGLVMLILFSSAVVVSATKPKADSVNPLLGADIPSKYRVQILSNQLTYYYILKLNEVGEVLGTMQFQKGGRWDHNEAVLIRQGSEIIRLNALAPEKSSQGYGFNDTSFNRNRVVVGSSGLRPFIWTPEEKLRDIDITTSGRFAVSDVNNSNQMVGIIRYAVGPIKAVRYNYPAGEIKELFNGDPVDINNKGSVVGSGEGANNVQLYTNKDGSKQIGDWYPKAINDNDVVVGYKINYGLAYRYTPGKGSENVAFQGSAKFNDVNNHGVIVGQFNNLAIIYTDSKGKQDLNLLVGLGSQSTLNEALAINDRGQILATGRVANAARVFLLTPIRR